MTKIFIISTIILLSGCGTGVINYSDNGVFEPYITAFETDAHSHGLPDLKVATFIHFGTTDKEGVIAQCEGNHLEIKVDQKWWDSHSFTDDNQVNWDRKALLYHELGHCTLNRDHENGILVDSRGTSFFKSIMHFSVVSGFDFKSKEEYYLQELFR